jgi:hypothetical protein
VSYARKENREFLVEQCVHSGSLDGDLKLEYLLNKNQRVLQLSGSRITTICDLIHIFYQDIDYPIKCKYISHGKHHKSIELCNDFVNFHDLSFSFVSEAKKIYLCLKSLDNLNKLESYNNPKSSLEPNLKYLIDKNHKVWWFETDNRNIKNSSVLFVSNCDSPKIGPIYGTDQFCVSNPSSWKCEFIRFPTANFLENITVEGLSKASPIAWVNSSLFFTNVDIVMWKLYQLLSSKFILPVMKGENCQAHKELIYLVDAFRRERNQSFCSQFFLFPCQDWERDCSTYYKSIERVHSFHDSTQMAIAMIPFRNGEMFYPHKLPKFSEIDSTEEAVFISQSLLFYFRLLLSKRFRQQLVLIFLLVIAVNFYFLSGRFSRPLLFPQPQHTGPATDRTKRND